MIDIFGFIGSIALLLGWWLVGLHKDRNGFIVNIIGNIIWGIISIIIGLSSMLFLCVSFIIISTISYIRWKNE